MNILITGAAGMIGRKLTHALVDRGRLAGHRIDGLTLVDAVAPALPTGVPGAALVADIAEPEAAAVLAQAEPDVIFHLAAVVSGEAEADVEKGYAVNLGATAALLTAIAARPGWRPRVVFASSIAVFGAEAPGALPDPVPDGQAPSPLTSYGTQKAMAELMIDDLTRRGALDGVSLRLPTICVRPGPPNAAASGFWSSILREPLAGHEAVLPVEDDLEHWFASPRAAVGFLIHAAEVDLGPLGPRRALNLPGVRASAGDFLAALEREAGPDAVARVRRAPDADIRRIVEPWPRGFAPARALSLGFAAEGSVAELIQAHLEDESRARPGS
jgi:nucleoside-diphosphate-sugar epimerase